MELAALSGANPISMCRGNESVCAGDSGHQAGVVGEACGPHDSPVQAQPNRGRRRAGDPRRRPERHGHVRCRVVRGRDLRQVSATRHLPPQGGAPTDRRTACGTGRSCSQPELVPDLPMAGSGLTLAAPPATTSTAPASAPSRNTPPPTSPPDPPPHRQQLGRAADPTSSRMWFGVGP